MKVNRSFPVREAVEQDIVTGSIRPGTRLDEATLARRFNVSRTPVREALMHLVASGLAEQQPHRGIFVVRRSASTIVEMFEVMAELEGLCGRLAARRASQAQLEAIVRANEACEIATSKDADAYYYANEIFHRSIYAASGNTFLAEQARILQNRLKPYRRLQLRVPGRLRSSSQEHQAIVSAILKSDTATTEAGLKAHILIQGERFTDFFAALGREDSEVSDRNERGR